jgi:hypothetical protein
MQANSTAVILGSMPNEMFGRALGPYRLRTRIEEIGFTASIIDVVDVLTHDEIDEMLAYTVGPDTLVIGFSCTWQVTKIKEVDPPWLTPELIRRIRRNFPHVKIVLGGASSVRIDDDLVVVADWVVSGFAEHSFPELLNLLSNKPHCLKYSSKKIKGHGLFFVSSDDDHAVQDMSNLSTVFKATDYYAAYQPLTTEISRGCLFSCAFCNFPFLGKKDYEYIRGVDSLADEFRRNYEMFGTTRYMFSDDTFNDSIEKISRVQRAVDAAKLPNFEFTAYIRPELLVTKPGMIPALAALGIRGAHFGIESFSNQARKAIGRPTDINKVLDSIVQLKAATNVRTHGSFIVGLPGDSTDDVLAWKDRFTKSPGEIFNSWAINPLFLIRGNTEQGISLPGSLKTEKNVSLIEKDPAKYGYEIIPEPFSDKPQTLYANWKNDHMDCRTALSISDEINADTASYRTAGGWGVATAWYFNFTDVEIDHDAIDWQLNNRLGRALIRLRANKILSDIRFQHPT